MAVQVGTDLIGRRRECGYLTFWLGDPLDHAGEPRAGLFHVRSTAAGTGNAQQLSCLFGEVGGYPDIPLMEDIALSKALKRIAAPLCLREKISTSGRRWERRGVARTILLMWRIRLAYYMGADPADLAPRYDRVR